MARPRLILDSNLYITYLLSPEPSGTASDILLEAAVRGAIELILPVDVIAEMSAVIAHRPYLRARIAPSDIEDLLVQIAPFVRQVRGYVGDPPRVSRDRKDDYLIALAVLHGANYLVTRDRDLLTLGAIFETTILDPGAMLAVLREQAK